VTRRPVAAALLVLGVVLGACDGAPELPPDTVEGAVAPAEVRIVGQALVLVTPDGGEQELTRLDPAVDGELVHAVVRPGERRTTTVLGLARVAAGPVPRYELRYLVVDEEGRATDLYGFPWRLQVDPDLAHVDDVPPLPVWSPDGSSIAWVEWDRRGAVLRTLAWRDDGEVSNPSDDVASYRLEQVPAGTQLAAWEDEDGVPVLLGDDGRSSWRIRLDVGRRAIALQDTA
jgi:hypothetical protein